MSHLDDTRRVAALAARQHGNIAVGQLLASGLSRMDVRLRVRQGWLLRRHTGVYAVGHVPATRRSRWMAATLAVGDEACLSNRAAGAFWEIRSRSVPTEVTVPTYAGHPHRDGIIVHRAFLPERHVTVKDGIPVTTVMRTVLDLAATTRHPRELERIFEQAQVLHGLEPIKVAYELELRRGYRGTARLRALLADAVDPRGVRSLLELHFLKLCEQFGIPRPLVNERLGIWRLDFFWPQFGLVMETDSAAFHSSLAARRRDPRKESELIALGLRVMRSRWRDVSERPAELAAAIHEAIQATPSVVSRAA